MDYSFYSFYWLDSLQIWLDHNSTYYRPLSKNSDVKPRISHCDSQNLQYKAHPEFWPSHRRIFKTSLYYKTRLILETRRYIHCWCKSHIEGLVQERCNSSALAMELHLSCTNPSIQEFCATRSLIHPQLSARLWYLQWVSNGDTTVSHPAINMSWRKIYTYGTSSFSSSTGSACAWMASIAVE